MKFSTVFAASIVALSQAQNESSPDMDVFRSVAAEMNGRSDGNALMIQQILQFYLGNKGKNTALAPKMLSYGCWCQILIERKGLGEPIDAFDEICHRYQQCSKCVAIDHAGTLVAGEQCNWETARYEIDFDADTGRMGCDLNNVKKNQCGFNQCSERL